MKHTAISIDVIVGGATTDVKLTEYAQPSKVIADIGGPHSWVLECLAMFLEEHVATPREVSGRQ